MTTRAYAGPELALFADARNWKTYQLQCLSPYLAGDVLEVGAGLGSFTKTATVIPVRRWVCCEPDPRMHQHLLAGIRSGELPRHGEAILGGIEDVPPDRAFDAIVYLDVLEHIEDDAGELRKASAHLRPGGHLVVLSPAHQWLFTSMDASVGHFRRYSRKTLSRLAPRGCRRVRLVYLDSAGLLASLGNKVVLRQSMPTSRQLAFWDRVLVPLSRVLDPVFFHRVGKSVLGVWRREAE